MSPELSRPFTPERIGRMTGFRIEAQPAERDALAARMGIGGILSLGCVLAGARHGNVVDIKGSLIARVVQDCVITAEPFEYAIADSFTVQCVPAGEEADEDDPDSVDQVPYDGNIIDLGELIAEQLALSLDPYPRSPGAELPEQETDPGPFAALLNRRVP